MRAPETERTGSAGHSLVKAQLELLDQAPIDVPRDHDLGLDMLVQVRDERRFESGLLLGVQVKAGRASQSGKGSKGKGGKYFSEPVKDDQGSVTGWWFRDRDSRHLDSWIRHDLPVIVVLHDLDAKLSHWAHVRAEDVRRTGKTFKIFVPREQILDHAHLPALLKVAASKRHGVSWEGSAWRYDGRTVAPGDRLRHALLAPRLIAPHQNTGRSHEIGPEECLALLAQARLRDIDFFADRHPSVPSLESAADSDIWAWRLVGAFAKALLEETAAPASELADSAPGPAERAAATVIAVCALIEREELTQAIQLLDSALEGDACDPTDHAWLLVQRSRVRADLDDRAGASADAASARLTVLTAPRDPSASAIAAAAAEAVFRAADWNGRDIENYITTSDTAISWWRMQNLSSAYDYATDRTFDTWAQRNVTYGFSGHPAYNELLAARWNASLCANVGSWRACGGLFARQLLIDGAGQEDAGANDGDVGEALRILQASGDADRLGHTIDRLMALGPLEPLRQAVAAVPLGNWSSRTFRGNLKLWRNAGNLLETDAADSAVAHCLNLLEGQADVPAAVHETLAVSWAVLEAVAGLLPSAGDSAHQRVRDFLVAGSPWDSAKDRELIVTVTGCLRAARVLSDAGDRNRWRTAAGTYADPASTIRLAMLGRIADTDEQAREALTAQIKNGNTDALYLVRDPQGLPPDAAQHAIQHLAANVDQAVDRLVEEGWSSSAGPRIARALSELNLTHPGQAQWAPLIKLMGTAQASDDYKRQLCFDLASNAERLPDEVRLKLTSPITAAMPAHDTVPDGGIVWLTAGLGLLTGQQETYWTVRLLAGTTQQRIHAAILMRLLRRPEHSLALTSLLADPSADVRAAAARECAFRALRDPADLVAAEGALLAAQHSSFKIPHAVASTFADTRPASPPQDSALISALTALHNHPSSLVRQLADRTDHLWSATKDEGLAGQPAQSSQA